MKLFLLVALALLSSDAKQAARVDSVLPIVSYHVAQPQDARNACGGEAHFATAAPLSPTTVIVKCVRVAGREVVVKSLLDVPAACGGYDRILQTEVFEDGSILAHCRENR